MPKRRVGCYWDYLPPKSYSLYTFLLYTYEYERPEGATKSTLYRDYEDNLNSLLTTKGDLDVINSKILSIKAC